MNRFAVAGLVAAAVGVITVPIAVVATGGFGSRSDPRPPPAATSPRPDTPETSSGPGPSATPSTIPADLSVSDGLPAARGGFERSASAITELFCGTQGIPLDGVLETRRDGAVGPEYADQRDLRVYADDAAAHGLLVAARDAVEACPSDEHGGTVWRTMIADADLGEESVRLVRTYETDGVVNLGATFWHLVRVGNAVLVTLQSGEYLPGETLAAGIADHERTLAPIVSRLCGFGASGCVTTGDIADDFPLAAGWPDDDVAEPGPHYGLSGPSRSLEPLTWTACERSFSATGMLDLLRADWTNVEDYRSRELLTFDDAETAVAFTGSLVGFWRDCPRQDHGDGYESVNDVHRTEVGGESWALVRWSEYDGAPAVGLTIVHVTRLGRAVLIDQTSSEGGGGPDRGGDIAVQIAAHETAAASVVSAMCRFTEAGC